VTADAAFPAEAAPRRLAALFGRARELLLQSLAAIVLLVVWEAVTRAGLVRPFLLPALSDVARRLGQEVAGGGFFIDAGLTLYRALAGFALAASVGIPVGMAIARGRLLRWFFDPIVSVGFPMPKIAFLPVFMLWFDVYDRSKIVMVAFAAVFTIVAAAEAGTRGVERTLIWSARSLGATRLGILREIVLPAAMPQILTGLQVALPVALITEVATEMLMGGIGLGGTMITAGRYADSVGVYAGIVETAAVGITAVALMARLRRRLLRWHAEFNPRG